SFPTRRSSDLNLSLMGFPFSLGFYSKDTIIGILLFDNFSYISFLFLLRCCFTVAYRFRLIFMGFIMFPSFSCRLRFVEDTYFYYPILFLYVTCVFFGIFFFFFVFDFFFWFFYYFF